MTDFIADKHNPNRLVLTQDESIKPIEIKTTLIEAVIPATLKAKNSKTIKYGQLELPVINDKNDYVPSESKKIKLSLLNKRGIAIAYKNNIPCLLLGDTGTGKTSAVRELAYKLQQGYTQINLTGYTSPDELIGSKSVKEGATYYELGVLTRAMIEGHICVLDEINMVNPDCSSCLHSLLEEKHITLPNGEVIKPHDNFRVYATMNPDYEGTKDLNQAFKDRFGAWIFVKILEPRAEEKLLIERTGITSDLARKFIAVAWLNRKAYTEGKTLTLISTRGLLQLSELIKEGLKPIEAYTLAIINKARIDEKLAFLDFYNIIFKTDEKNPNCLPIIMTPDEVKIQNDNIEALKTSFEDIRRKAWDTEDKLSKTSKELEENKLELQQQRDYIRLLTKDKNSDSKANTSKNEDKKDDASVI